MASLGLGFRALRFLFWQFWVKGSGLLVSVWPVLGLGFRALRFLFWPVLGLGVQGS